jgi:hypothetical protein
MELLTWERMICPQLFGKRACRLDPSRPDQFKGFTDPAHRRKGGVR